jgi:hypothetical protein
MKYFFRTDIFRCPICVPYSIVKVGEPIAWDRLLSLSFLLQAVAVLSPMDLRGDERRKQRSLDYDLGVVRSSITTRFWFVTKLLMNF